MSEAYDRPSLEPRFLVCSKCWLSFFSKPEFKHICNGDDPDDSFEYHVSLSDTQASAARDCPWCRFILSTWEAFQGDNEAFEDLYGPQVSSERTTVDAPGMQVEGSPEYAGERPPNLPLSQKKSIAVRFGPGLFQESFTPAGHNRFTIRVDGWVCYLTAFTSSDDTCSKMVTARQLESQVYSDYAFHQIHAWLNQCGEHKTCPPMEVCELPSRVVQVDVDGRPDETRLLATNGLFGNYLALSYCWGGRQNVVTTLKNLKAHQQSLPTKSLSRTIQDAIDVTRRMGMKYLWVDALCIVQDSAEDKIIELAKMRSVFQNASVTIVAASSEKANQGFLGDRAPPQPSVKVPFWNKDGELGTASLRPEGWYDADSEPVNTRAWTLEERLLSARLLIYANHTLQYQCQYHTVNLGGSIHIPAGLGSWRLPDFIFQRQIHHIIDPESRLHQLMEAWRSIISQYSRRLLTDPEDKLHALGGVAEDFYWQVQQPYLAGLWGGDLLPGLLIWRSDDYAVKSPIYNGPSWSWSSLTSPVSYHELPDDGSYGWWHVDSCAAETTLKVDRLPFGSVTNARLEIRARTRKGFFRPPQYIVWDDDQSGEDRVESWSELYASCDGREESGTLVICVPLLWRSGEIREESVRVHKVFDSSVRLIDGLLVMPSQNEDAYCRIGSFYGAAEEEFQNCPQSNLTLI